MNMSAVAGYSPKQQTLARLPELSLQRLKAVIHSKGSISDRHNAFTDYCLGLLFCCTGHRAVNDPFSDLGHFDLDDGLLLINDKVSDETRAWRLVALPDLAIHQVKKYQKYLGVLAARLQSRDRTRSLSAQVLSLYRGGADMPLFFYLRESLEGWVPVTPAALAKRWADFWQLPVNFQRHIMADTLLQLSQRADWVSIQLGHADGVDHPFGSASNRSVIETLHVIRPYLNDGLLRMGWSEVRPPLSGAMARDTSRAPKTASTPVIFGHERREVNRKKRRTNCAEFVRSLWGEQFSGGAAVNSESVQLLAQQIILQAPSKAHSINWCLQLLYQYIRSRPGGSSIIRQLARYRRIEVEQSPFYSGSLVDYKKAKDLRTGFIAYLDRQGRNGATLNLHTRLAEIVFSAALLGGLANTERLETLGSSLITHTYLLDNILFVDLPLGQADATFRWFPDPVSKRLIFGLFRMDTSSSSFSSSQLKTSLKFLAEQVGKQGSRKPIGWLAKIAEAALTIEMPGYIAACLRGDVPVVALPLPQWVRVVTGRRLEPFEQDLTPNISDKSFWSPMTKQDSLQNHTAAEGRAFLRNLGRIVSEARNIKAHGRLLPSLRSKRELAKQLKNASNDQRWSTLQMMLVAWTVHLCQHGTRYQKDIAYSTVEKYISFVASRLVMAAADQSLDVHDEIVLEDLYLRAVECEAPERRFELASRFYEMHAFFTDAYLLEDLDWSAVMGAAGGRKKRSYADANYVSSAEYRLALQSLIQETSLRGRRRWQYAGLLLLGYRFGLRFGEALRLRYSDIQRDGDELCVWVHHSAHGETKSAAGVRVLPLIERLDALEIDIVDHLLAASEADFAEHAGALLMTDRAGSVELLDRADAARVLNGLLRRVTGDGESRFHHLRHGWVTRAVAAQAGRQAAGFDEQLSEAARDEFFGDDAGFPLRSVAVGAGHASERTTLASYTHNLDQLAQAHYQAPSQGDYSISYAEQIAYATVRTRRRRAGRSSAGRPPAIPRPAVATKPLRAISLSDLTKRTTVATVDICLVDVDRLLRRYSDSKQPVERIAETMGLEVVTAKRVVNRALEVELQTGYDGYGLAQRSADPVAASVKGAGYSQFVRETARVEEVLTKVRGEFDTLLPIEKKRVLEGLDAWVETVDASRSTCRIVQMEHLTAIVGLSRFLGVDVKAVLPAAANTQSMRALLELHGVAYRVVEGKRALGIQLKIAPVKGPVRTLQRLLLIMSISLDF